MRRTLFIGSIALFCGIFAVSTVQSVAAPAEQPTTAPAAAYPLDICPISGEKLGGDMGAPVVKQIDGREVRFCCNSCLGAFSKDAEANHKKMDDLIIAAKKDAYPLTKCIVTDEPFGGDMGEPLLYVHRPTNQLVKFCCKGCLPTFKKEPEKYLAKLAAK